MHRNQQDANVKGSKVKQSFKRKAEEGVDEKKPPQKIARNDRKTIEYVLCISQCPSSITNEIIEKWYKGLEISKVVRQMDKATKKPTGDVLVIFGNEEDGITALRKGLLQGPDGQKPKGISKKSETDITNQLYLIDIPETIDAAAIANRYKVLGEDAIVYNRRNPSQPGCITLTFRTPDLCLKALALGPFQQNGKNIGSAYMNTKDFANVLVSVYPPKLHENIREKHFYDHFVSWKISANEIRHVSIYPESCKAYVHFAHPSAAREGLKMGPLVIDGCSLEFSLLSTA